MQSFLDINWENYGNYLRSVPEAFILGPFMQGLNDPIQHKEFGLSIAILDNCQCLTCFAIISSITVYLFSWSIDAF